MEKSALDLLQEINENLSPEKASRAAILIPKLREAIEEMERAEQITAEANFKVFEELHERLMPLDSPAFENTFQANIELHEKLGDKPISDCHNVECEEHPGLDYYFCPKCLETDEEGKRTGEPAIAKYHWEETKKQFAVLSGITNKLLINPDVDGDGDTNDDLWQPYIFNTEKEAQKFAKEKQFEASDDHIIVVELKEVSK